jgi:predicted peroxiredoxin
MAKIVVLISHGANSDKSTIAMTIANAAKSAGNEVAIFLTSDAVYLAKHGYTDLAPQYRPFKTLEELTRQFLDAKGVLWACTPCVQHRGLKNEDMLEGVIVTGSGPLVEWLGAGAQTVCY